MSPELLEQLVGWLQKDNGRTPPPAPALAHQIAEEGWAYEWMLDDYLIHYDGRLHMAPIEHLLSFFDVRVEHVLPQPKYLTAGAMLHRALRAADAASFFIRLEEIGFDVDPGPLVERLLPEIKAKERITVSELDVLQYTRSKDKQDITIRSTADPHKPPWDGDKRKDARGRRIEWTRAGAATYSLRVRGPGYRTPPRRPFVKCDYCAHQYTKGDPESRDFHLAEHARARRLLDPTPSKEFAKRLAAHAQPELVVEESPVWMHRAVYERALRFKRDFGYDFVQWAIGRDGKNRDPRSHGYLFAGDVDGTIGGACGFWREDDGGWRLMWVWVTPKMRRQGLLERRWQIFLDRYGDFTVEAPYSAAMHAFLLKKGTEAQRAIAQKVGFDK